VQGGRILLLMVRIRPSHPANGRLSSNVQDKNAIGEYAKSTGAFKAVVNVGAGWYFENFLSRDLAPSFGGFPYILLEGTLVLRVPKWGGKEKVPFIAIGDDFGDIVHGVFLEPEKWTGKLVSKRQRRQIV
jgi:hypothetical protein